MCVLICLLRREGRSNFLPHISQGSHVLSLFLLIGLSLGTICSGLLFVISDSEHSNFILIWSSLPLTFEGQSSALAMGDVKSDEDIVGEVKNNFSLLADSEELLNSDFVWSR